MASQTISFDLAEICTLEGHIAPIASEHEGHLILEYACDSPDQATKTAKAVVRELVKFRQDKHVQGTRTGKKIMFAFGMMDQELPATWRGHSNAATGAKPALLVDIQKALQPYAKAMYFNSSVNHGLTVDNVPVGLQFETKADGDTVAKLLLSKKGEWTSIPIDNTDQAIELVQRLQALLAGL